MPRKNLPGYLKHKPSGQAYCLINGKFIYLGKYGSKASRQQYEEVVAEYLANGKKLPPTRSKNEITVLEFAIGYLEYAKEYYSINTKTYNLCENTMKLLVKYYGKQPISKFGPLSLKFLREKWIDEGHSLNTVRKKEGQIKNAFRWGLENEHVPTDVVHAICLVRGLKRGRSKARAPEEVQPIADEIVQQTLPYCLPIIADMIQVQRLCGFRPQDVINLRSCDIDRSKTPWKYKPYTHKTQYRGKARELAIGPKARAILSPYIIEKAETPEAFLFSPADSMKLFRAEQRQNRKSKVQPSQRNRRKASPKRKPKEKYTTCSYNRAIDRAITKYNKDETKAAKKENRQPVVLPKWSPNQLRHSASTEIREKYGLDHAQAVMGHSSAKTTEIYAKVSFDKAAEVMEEIG